MDAKNSASKHNDFKNNMTRFLDAQKVKYQVFTYSYDEGVHSAVEVAAAIGLPVAQVFKTLVAQADGQWFLGQSKVYSRAKRNL